MFKALSHVAVRVTDVEKSVEFYCDVLGLREKFRLTDEEGNPHLVYVQVAEGQFIELFPGAEGANVRAKTSGLVHICLEVEDIQNAFAELAERGLKATGEPKLGGDNSWQFWTTDPDGNPIEFHQFTPESMQLADNGWEE